MITDALLDFFQAGMTWFIGLFPTSSFDPFQYLAGALAQLGAINYFLPLSEMATLFVAFWVLTPTWISVTLGLFIFSQFRGSSSRG